MPSLSAAKDLMLGSVGCSEVELEKWLFEFGVELDDVYEEGGKIMYKFDIAANRYDLLCTEGLIAALKAFIYGVKYTDIYVEPPSITVHKYPTAERPHIACAVIRNIKLTQETYDSLISYQDKLHMSIGRNRSIVAIGTHDADKLSGKIAYKRVSLSDLNFAPLGSREAVNGARLEEHFRDDKKISKYFDLLEERSESVVFSSGDTVMSLPPIINSEATRLSLDTKNIFIDVTGADFEKVNTVLKLLLYNFRGEAVESVRIEPICGSGGVEDDGDKAEAVGEGADDAEAAFATPVFHNRKYEVEPWLVNKKLNLKLSTQEIKGLLERMMYNVDVEDSHLLVRCVDVRSDILHVCDIIEDVAIAYGYNSFVRAVPAMYTAGAEEPLNKFCDKVRGELALAGFLEVLTLTLLSRNENFVSSEKQVVLSNPKSREYEVVRTSLLPGILKALASNLHVRIPIRVFEAADVVQLDPDVPEGARNRRMLCGCIASNSSLLEELQGPLSFLLKKCGVRDYSYEPFAEASKYLPNQSAVVKIGDRAIGDIGVLHPRVCANFKIPYAASSFELDLELLFEHFIANN